eukprot:TRINITY_DN4476_c0_g1_i6.p2 TRINITY_DN4476_c0_g1~~TRINITY_DN4476_c0_g1_i6.p2  ORF type:complete len:116 (+),score=5.39 TRINITY_DN4476_c0_g1_i6:643-990(+)
MTSSKMNQQGGKLSAVAMSTCIHQSCTHPRLRLHIGFMNIAPKLPTAVAQPIAPFDLVLHFRRIRPGFSSFVGQNMPKPYFHDLVRAQFARVGILRAAEGAPGDYSCRSHYPHPE